MTDLISSDSTRPSRRRLRRIGAAGAVGVGLALGAFGISSAASPSPSPGSSAVQPQQGMPGPDDMGRHLRGMGPDRMGRDELGLRGAIRGDIVVPDGKGGYRTVRMQRGKVTAKTASSLTVQSADGKVETYAVPAGTLVNAARDGLGSIAIGDEVGVRAIVSGGTATATRIRDLTKLPVRRPGGPPAASDGTPAAPSSYRS